ncbi:hypothetical protein KAR91_65200, partial [Candidatus Pacearchaeota archaeon]|nr:hypothetical protein [Candidatus Pacearchaeota archaeon]
INNKDIEIMCNEALSDNLLIGQPATDAVLDYLNLPQNNTILLADGDDQLFCRDYWSEKLDEVMSWEKFQEFAKSTRIDAEKLNKQIAT